MKDMIVDEQPTDFNCLRYLVDTHDEFCTPFEDYSLKYVKYLVNTCETETQDEVQKVALKLKEVCSITMPVMWDKY